MNAQADVGTLEGVFRTLLVLLVILAGYRFVRPTSPHRLPPLVSSSAYIPYVGSAIEFNRAPLKFLRECHRKYGGPFRVRFMGKEMVIVVGRDDFTPVIRNKALSFDPVMEDAMKSIFQCDSKEPELRFEDADGGPIEDEHNGLWHRTHAQYPPLLRSRTAVAGLTARTFRFVNDSLWRLASEQGGRPQEVNLFAWIEKLTFGAVLRSLFGECSCLGTVDEVFGVYGQLHDAFPILAAGLPPFVTKLAAGKQLEAYDRLVTKWQRMILDDDQQGMADACELINVRNGDFERQFKYKVGSSGERQERAALLQAKFHASLLFGGYTNTAPTLFWMIYYLARDPRAWQAVYDEIRRELGDPDEGDVAWTSADLDRLSVMDSALTETLRLTNGASMPRVAMTDTTLTFGHGASARTYDVPAGQHIMMVGVRGARVADEVGDEEFDNDADEFRFDRYANGKQPTGARNVTPFGAGGFMCPGRFWARNVVKTAVALFMINIERVEFASEQAGPLEFDLSRVLMGIYRPVGDVAVHLHWRSRADRVAGQ
ncbi:Cytochrome P450 [Plasmodiophora brassicae]|uniref:Cytochrome P450 n=1 Tax=Plasmodiophora brassicae TaxID=37360 RepID=A0A0G4IXF9_PLABS|nr:hypothetical protein PBRA_007533 [Plasmodiophora brassicae]SPR02108.1 unnamed protein product [Plasmodiophora brassicae]